ncbi:MAG: YCF48-related protein [Pseudomonadota bacterium]
MVKKKRSPFIFLISLCISLTIASLHAESVAELQPLAKKTLLLDIVNQAGLNVAVGARGHILYTDNGDWQQANVPAQELLSAVFMLDEKTGWAVGHHNIILKTIDGAKNWNRQYFTADDEAPLLDIYFFDESNGIAIGAYGLLLRTTDGGNNWQEDYLQHPSGFDPHLNAITSSPAGILFIVGESGSIFRSNDNGESWQSIDSPYHGSLFGALSISEQSIIIFGLQGQLFKSMDAGETWDKIETPNTVLLTDALLVNQNKVLLTGLAGTLLITDENLTSINIHQLAGRTGISAVIQDAEQLWLVGEKGLQQVELRSLFTPN